MILNLFANGQSARIRTTLYRPPTGSGRPVDAYVVKDCPPSVLDAAKRGAEAAYAWLDSRDKQDPVIAAFDLEGLADGDDIIGGSGGLAFAAAMAGELLKGHWPDIAATGIIESGAGNASVRRVEGIVNKLREAGDKLPSGGMIFYPAENKSELPENVISAIEQKGLTLYPVSSVEEMFTCLKSPKEETGSKSRLMTVILLAGLAVALATFLVINHQSGHKKAPSPSHKITAPRPSATTEKPVPPALSSVPSLQAAESSPSQFNFNIRFTSGNGVPEPFSKLLSDNLKTLADFRMEYPDLQGVSGTISRKSRKSGQEFLLLDDLVLDLGYPMYLQAVTVALKTKETEETAREAAAKVLENIRLRLANSFE